MYDADQVFTKECSRTFFSRIAFSNLNCYIVPINYNNKVQIIYSLKFNELSSNRKKLIKIIETAVLH